MPGWFYRTELSCNLIYLMSKRTRIKSNFKSGSKPEFQRGPCKAWICFRKQRINRKILANFVRVIFEIECSWRNCFPGWSEPASFGGHSTSLRWERWTSRKETRWAVARTIWRIDVNKSMKSFSRNSILSSVKTKAAHESCTTKVWRSEMENHC